MVKFTISGLDEARKKLSALAKNYPKKLKTGLVTWGEIVMTRSKEEFVPIDTGALKNSGMVTPAPDRIAITLSYGGAASAYAVPVHENPHAHHPVGEYKYLEKPLLEAAGTLEADVRRFGKITEADLR